MNKNKLALAAAAAGTTLFGVAAPSARAELLDPGLYVLLNHPSNGVDSYGLRLDELYNVNLSQQDWFIFDFEHSNSLVVMEVTADTIRISGEVHGGYYRPGQGYVAGPHLGTYSFDFLYNMGVQFAPNDDDRIINAANNVNTGTITTPMGDTIALWDERGGNPFSFRLGDEDNDQGHRGYDGISGWGWLNHGPDPDLHRAVGDFIFRVGPEIPAPGAAVTLALGLGVLTRRRR